MATGKCFVVTCKRGPSPAWSLFCSAHGREWEEYVEQKREDAEVEYGPKRGYRCAGCGATCVCECTLSEDTHICEGCGNVAYVGGVDEDMKFYCEECVANESAPCACCGKERGECGCKIATVPDHDPAVGYYADETACLTHRCKVEGE